MWNLNLLLIKKIVRKMKSEYRTSVEFKLFLFLYALFLMHGEYRTSVEFKRKWEQIDKLLKGGVSIEPVWNLNE